MATRITSDFYTNLNDEPDKISELSNGVSHPDSGDTIGARSFPTAPVTLLDLPEPTHFHARFIYNFYVRDERTNSRGTILTFDSGDTGTEGADSAYNDFVTGKQRPPRGVLLTLIFPDYSSAFTGEAVENAQNAIKGIIEGLPTTEPIKTYYDKIVSEDSLSTGYFSSAHIRDDYADRVFYNEISSSVAFFGEDVNIIGKESLESIGADAHGPFLNGGSEIRKSLKNIQSKGISYAPTDVRREISSDAFTSVTNVDFAMSFNNKFISNILEYSTNDRVNIYDNEIEGLREAAERVQKEAVASTIPGAITSDEFSFGVDAIHIETVEDVALEGDFSGPVDWDEGPKPSPGPGDSTRPNIGEYSTPIGFILEKFEITQGPDGNWRRTELPPIIVERWSDTFHLIDPDVKYGATYIYNARMVTATRFEALRIAPSDGSGEPDQVVMATMFIKSSGSSVKIDCVEHIPPNPPQNLKFHWDYKNDELMLFWEEAMNKQRDVVRYQIFKRKSIDVPYTIIQELDFDHSTSRVVPVEQVPESLITQLPGSRKVYRDKEFKRDTERIYALASVDARGFTSCYSMQCRVRFDSSRNKLKVDVISKSGAPKPYPNVYLRQDLFVDTMKASNMNRIRVFFNPEAFDITRSTPAGTAASAVTNVSQKFISPNYKIQIINIDNQMSKVIDINIKDETGPPRQVEY